jgi:hypothetical protein
MVLYITITATLADVQGPDGYSRFNYEQFNQFQPWIALTLILLNGVALGIYLLNGTLTIPEKATLPKAQAINHK